MGTDLVDDADRSSIIRPEDVSSLMRDTLPDRCPGLSPVLARASREERERAARAEADRAGGDPTPSPPGGPPISRAPSPHFSTKFRLPLDQRPLSRKMHLAALGLAAGKAQSTIARELKVAPATVLRWTKRDNFQQVLAYLQDITLRNTRRRAKAILDKASERAAEKLVTQMDTSESERIQHDASTQILDRSLGKPVQPSVTMHAEVPAMTQEDRGEILRVAREAGLVPRDP